MEDTISATISTMDLARQAGCVTSIEVAAYCAAKWCCSIDQAWRRIPNVKSQLSRISPDEVLLTIQNIDLPPVIWDKIIVVRDCNRAIDAETQAAFGRAVAYLIRNVPSACLFELVTYGATSRAHGECVMTQDQVSVHTSHADAAADEHALSEMGTTGQAGSNIVHALNTAKDTATDGRTLIVVIAHNSEVVDDIQPARIGENRSVFTRLIHVGTSNTPLRAMVDIHVHCNMQQVEECAIECISDEMQHVADPPCIDVTTTSVTRPVVLNAVLPSVRRATAHAKCIAHHHAKDLYEHQKRGMQAFLERDLETATAHGIVWLGERMFYKCTTIPELHPIVDAQHMNNHRYIAPRPLYAHKPIHVILRLRETNNDAVSVHVHGEVCLLRGSNATRMGEIRRQISEHVRWASTINYIATALQYMTHAQVENIAAKAIDEDAADRIREYYAMAQTQDEHAEAMLHQIVRDANDVE